MAPASLPSRERGLKYCGQRFDYSYKYVAPFTGAWIEMCLTVGTGSMSVVAPFTGAWIEIMLTTETMRVFSGRSLHGSVD